MGGSQCQVASPVNPNWSAGPLPAVVVGRHARHGHVGAVREEDQDGQQAGQGAGQAELDDARATKLQLVHKEAAQEGAASTRRHHQVPCERGRAQPGLGGPGSLPRLIIPTLQVGNSSYYPYVTGGGRGAEPSLSGRQRRARRGWGLTSALCCSLPLGRSRGPWRLPTRGLCPAHTRGPLEACGPGIQCEVEIR